MLARAWLVASATVGAGHHHCHHPQEVWSQTQETDTEDARRDVLSGVGWPSVLSLGFTHKSLYLLSYWTVPLQYGKRAQRMRRFVLLGLQETL